MLSRPWTIALALVAILLYAVAISHAVYDLTSPASLSWHVVLRKTYSIVAFAIVGYLLRRTLGEYGRAEGRSTIVACILGVAAYSAAIEVGQFLHGSQEGFTWNVIDTVCGAIGGTISVADLIFRRRAGSHEVR